MWNSWCFSIDDFTLGDELRAYESLRIKTKHSNCCSRVRIPIQFGLLVVRIGICSNMSEPYGHTYLSFMCWQTRDEAGRHGKKKLDVRRQPERRGPGGHPDEPHRQLQILRSRTLGLAHRRPHTPPTRSRPAVPASEHLAEHSPPTPLDHRPKTQKRTTQKGRPVVHLALTFSHT